jgi:high-affinity Fe2+/Pb2+ permease
MFRRTVNAMAAGIATGSLVGFLFAVLGLRSPIAAFLISGTVSSVVAAYFISNKGHL